jgi:hypothetical protein
MISRKEITQTGVRTEMEEIVELETGEQEMLTEEVVDEMMEGEYIEGEVN